MNETLQSMAEAVKARIKASKANAESYKRYTIDECINILETMEAVNDEIFMKAIEKFKQDPDDREIFVNMSLARGMVWLGRL
ncbi:hypothetical protein RGQ29_028053 [Quercus rubra]|uniref:Uncharacterized protein n=1 Tax=Quercus rubra TaxID=3512 RepID=A0AAN7IM55_QUERU|nr:hypothetical protein RGQ29_028053 [Quercus rubra]